MSSNEGSPIVGVVSDAKVYEEPTDLAQRCAFPVLVPSYWPEQCRPAIYTVNTIPLVPPGNPARTSYGVRSPQVDLDSILLLHGSPADPDQHHSDDLTPVSGMPWPTLVRTVDRLLHVLVQCPGTLVHIVGTVALGEVLAVARSLELVDSSPPTP